MKCYACGKENHTINYLGRNICAECWRLVHIAEKKIENMVKVTYKAGNYYIQKPILQNKLPFYLTAGTGIAIIILMLIERTVN